MLISITDQSKKKRKEYAKRKRPRDKVWVGQNPPKLEFGWVGVPFGRLIHTKPASKFPKVPKKTPSHACQFPNWKWCPGIRFQFFSVGAKPTSPSPFNEGLIVPKPVTERQQYLTVQVPFQPFLLCLWIIWGFDITNTRQCFNAFKTPLKQYGVFQGTSRFSDPYSDTKNVLPSIW